MSALVQRDQSSLAQVSDQEMMTVLQNSLYPGAAPASIQLVLGYCRAAGLDPMLKPVHIVPMWDAKSRGMRDTVMPGIGLYRTQAARTGQFAGMGEPEFGPDCTEELGGVVVTFPEWARVTVKRVLPNGIIAEFTAKEFWLENYATKGGAEKSIAPNAMWLKRKRGQIGKCAAAQALRIAFPELGAMPTAEEMEGKDVSERDITPQVVTATVVDDPNAKRRAELVATLEAAARTNGATLKAEFAKVSQDDRAILGGAEWNRIKALVVPTKTEEPPKPTYAQIMATINEAADPAALSEALGVDMTHLTEQMRGELIDAGKHRMEGM